MKLVFVYGTLKRGHSNARLLKESRFLRHDMIPGRLYFIGHNSFPYAIPALTSKICPDFPRIRGEVYEVDEDVLDRLDRLEGVPDHYERISVKTDSGLSVWIYTPSESVKLYASSITVIPGGYFIATEK